MIEPRQVAAHGTQDQPGVSRDGRVYRVAPRRSRSHRRLLTAGSGPHGPSSTWQENRSPHRSPQAMSRSSYSRIPCLHRDAPDVRARHTSAKPWSGARSIRACSGSRSRVGRATARRQPKAHPGWPAAVYPSQGSPSTSTGALFSPFAPPARAALAAGRIRHRSSVKRDSGALPPRRAGTRRSACDDPGANPDQLLQRGRGRPPPPWAAGRRSICARSSGVRRTSSAPRSSSRQPRRWVPGIGTSSGPRASTQARASWASVQPFSSAVRPPCGWVTRKKRAGRSGPNFSRRWCAPARGGYCWRNHYKATNATDTMHYG